MGIPWTELHLDDEENLDTALSPIMDEDDLFRHGKILWFNPASGELEEVRV